MLLDEPDQRWVARAFVPAGRQDAVALIERAELFGEVLLEFGLRPAGDFFEVVKSQERGKYLSLTRRDIAVDERACEFVVHVLRSIAAAGIDDARQAEN
jgi:hypothetical protein